MLYSSIQTKGTVHNIGSSRRTFLSLIVRGSTYWGHCICWKGLKKCEQGWLILSIPQARPRLHNNKTNQPWSLKTSLHAHELVDTLEQCQLNQSRNTSTSVLKWITSCVSPYPLFFPLDKVMQWRSGKTWKKRERERESRCTGCTVADTEKAGWADIGRQTQREREREMQTVIRADMYKVLCGLRLPHAHKPRLTSNNQHVVRGNSHLCRISVGCST